MWSCSSPPHKLLLTFKPHSFPILSQSKLWSYFLKLFCGKVSFHIPSNHSLHPIISRVVSSCLLENCYFSRHVHQFLLWTKETWNCYNLSTFPEWEFNLTSSGICVFLLAIPFIEKHVFYFKYLSGLRLHVTGLISNADNLITITVSCPKIFVLNGKVTDPAVFVIPSIIQFEVVNYSTKCVFQFLSWKTSIFDSVFLKAKQHQWYFSCKWKSHGLILCAKTDIIFSLLINDWSFLWADKTIGKECGSIVSSCLLGGALPDDTKNGCKGDKFSRGCHETFCWYLVKIWTAGAIRLSRIITYHSQTNVE